MSRFHVKDLPILEISPTSPAALREKLGELLIHSTSAGAKVEMLNKETGEYRVVLRGTLDQEDLKLER